MLEQQNKLIIEMLGQIAEAFDKISNLDMTQILGDLGDGPMGRMLTRMLNRG